MATVMQDLALRLFAQTSELKSGLKEASNAGKSFKQNATKTGAEVKKSFSTMSKEASSALGGMTDGLSSISPAASGAVGGFKSMAVGARALNAALGPIGIIIAAVAIAIKALMSYFKGSVDGAEKFAKIMGFIKGILGFVQDLAIKLGRALVDAFENPKEAVASLWEAIKQNLYNRWTGLIDYFKATFNFLSNGLNGVGYAIKGIFDDEAKKKSKEFFGAMVDDIKDMGAAAAQVNTGITPDGWKAIGGAIVDTGKKAVEVGKASAALAVRGHQLEMDRITLIRKRADIETEISKLKLIADDKANYSDEERLKAIKQAGKLVKQLGDEELRIATEAYNIKKETNALGESGVDDVREEATLYAEQVNTLKTVNDQLREITTKQYEIAQGIKAQSDANQKAADAQSEAYKKQKEEAIKTANEIIAKNKEIENSTTPEGRLANIKAIYDAEYKALDEKFAYEEMKTQEYYDAKAAIAAMAERAITEQTKAEAEIRKQALSDIAYQTGDALMSITTTVGDFQTAAMNKELESAGNNEKKKDEIRKRYAKKQQKVSIAQALINGALAITRAFADLGPIAAAIFSGLITANTAAQVAVIKSQAFADGGIVSGPTLGLVGEYPGARSNPEVIAPLDKLKTMLGDGMYDKNFRFVIEGRDLVTLYNKESKLSKLY